MKTIYSWRQKKYPSPNRTLLKQLMNDALIHSGLHEKSNGTGTVSFTFCGPKTIAEVNWDFLRHEGMTDVISFDYSGDDFDEPTEESVIAEIIICVDQADIEAQKRNIPFEDELILYIVHGILHMTGIDDIDPDDRKIMRRREKEVITELKKKFNFSEIFTRE